MCVRVCVYMCMCVCVCMCVFVYTCCHCSGAYDTHIISKVMLIFYVWVKEHLVKNRPISIPLGSVIPILFMNTCVCVSSCSVIVKNKGSGPAMV